MERSRHQHVCLLHIVLKTLATPYWKTRQTKLLCDARILKCSECNRQLQNLTIVTYINIEGNNTIPVSTRKSGLTRRGVSKRRG